jgi:hypothetical protein
MSLKREIPLFTDVFVTTAPNKSNVIQWTLDVRFSLENAITGFHIDISRGGEWIRITTDLIDDMCVYVDEVHYFCALRADLYYRVVAIDADGNEYKSKPVHVNEGWKDRHQRLVAREIIRKEYLRLQKLPTGVEGKLLKPRQHGIPCHVCVDYDTQEVATPSCINCFGVGIEGGYYNAIPYWLDIGGTSSVEKATATFGLIDNKKRVARGVAYPLVNPGDVWVVKSNNKRFYIDSVQSVAETLFIPLIYQLNLSEIAQSNVAYKVPMEQEVEEFNKVPEVIIDNSFDEDITKNETW